MLKPRAVTTHRHRMGRAHGSVSHERLQNRLHEAVLRVADQPFAVRPEIGQSALAVPDGDGWARRDSIRARHTAKGFDRAQAGRQPSLRARLLYGVEIDAAVGGKPGHQFAQMFLIADVAGAGRVPEMHDPNAPWAGHVFGQTQTVSGKKNGSVTERPDVSALKPPESQPKGRCTQDGDQRDCNSTASGE